MTKLRAEPRLADLRGRADGRLRDVELRLAADASRSEDLERLARFRQLRDEALFRDTRSAEVSGIAPQARARAAAAEALAVFGAPGGRPDSLTPAERAEVAEGRYLVLMVRSEALARPMPGEEPRAQAAEAIRDLDLAATLRAPTTAYHLRRAACLELAGDAGDAAIERGRAAQVDPAGAFNHLLLGQEWARRREWDRARQQYESALRRQPDLFWAHCLLAVAELNSAPPRVAEARAELTTCLGRQPDYAWLYLLRGFAHGQMGATLASAARQSPRGKAMAAESDARFEDAEADFAEAIRRGLDGPLRYALLIDRGTMRYQRGRFGDATADFSAAIGLEGDRPLGHLSMAQPSASSTGATRRSRDSAGRSPSTRPPRRPTASGPWPGSTAPTCRPPRPKRHCSTWRSRPAASRSDPARRPATTPGAAGSSSASVGRPRPSGPPTPPGRSPRTWPRPTSSGSAPCST